jgi:hypothetical protein
MAAALAVFVVACGGGAATSVPSPSPSIAGGGDGGVAASGPAASGEPADSPPASDEPNPTPDGSDGTSGAITLRGHLVAHTTQPLSTADQTIDFELRWNAGPDDIHDIAAFQFLSGSYTFSESIDGVCGGARSADGPLAVFSDTSLQAELDDPDQLAVVLVDERLDTGAVAITTFSGLYVSEPDPAGCAELSRAGVIGCTLRFAWLAVGRLEEEATCSDSSLGAESSGTLVPLP